MLLFTTPEVILLACSGAWYFQFCFFFVKKLNSHNNSETYKKHCIHLLQYATLTKHPQRNYDVCYHWQWRREVKPLYSCTVNDRLSPHSRITPSLPFFSRISALPQNPFWQINPHSRISPHGTRRKTTHLSQMPRKWLMRLP